MSTIFVATSECKGCGACLRTCPERALRPADTADGGPPLLTLEDRCTGCGECLEICPADAFVEWPAGGRPPASDREAGCLAEETLVG